MVSRTAKKLPIRDQVIEAASRLFAARGFDATPLQDIADEVGVTKQAVLHHFPTKVALLEAVLDHRDTVDEADLDDDLARGTDYFDALVHLVERNAVRRHIVELVAERLKLEGPPAPMLELTLRGWFAVVEMASVEWLGTGALARDELESWLVDQLVAMLYTTARHDPATAAQLGSALTRP